MKLKLYVAGTRAASTLQLVRRIQSAIAEVVKQDLASEIEVVSIMDDPTAAVEDDVVATRTLVRASPLPRQSALANSPAARDLILSLRIDLAAAPSPVPAPSRTP